MLAERFLDDRRLLPARRFDLDLPAFLPLEADRRRDRERPFEAPRLEQLLLRELLRFIDLLRLRETLRFLDLLRLRETLLFFELLRFRDPARFPQLRFRERDLRPLEAERFLLPVK